MNGRRLREAVNVSTFVSSAIGEHLPFEAIVDAQA